MTTGERSSRVLQYYLGRILPETLGPTWSSCDFAIGPIDRCARHPRGAGPRSAAVRDHGPATRVRRALLRLLLRVRRALRGSVRRSQRADADDNAAVSTVLVFLVWIQPFSEARVKIIFV